jgi:hypothetical protein
MWPMLTGIIKFVIVDGYIFINVQRDIGIFFENQSIHSTFHYNLKIKRVLYMDDLALLAKEEMVLQDMIDKLTEIG